jgi:hypothetical protein
MRKFMLPLTVLLLLAPLALQGREKDKMDNPYKNAKVGDYVEFKVTTSFGGMDIELEMKQTLTAKDDKEATVKTTSTFMGKETPAQTQKIDLTKPFDIADTAMQAKKQGKFEKTGEGKEKVKIGNKTYECQWMAGKVTAEAKGQKIESNIKVWMSKDVPLSGLVKMEMKSDFINMQMEISGSGSAK